MSRQQQRTGKVGEEFARRALEAVGVRMVEKIGTPVRIVPGRRPIYGERVSGDHRGVAPGGISVLAETKTIVGRNLVYSDLREHQPGRLTLHADLDGISLLVWVYAADEVFIMRWPVPGFEPGTSITPERARELAIRSL